MPRFVRYEQHHPMNAQLQACGIQYSYTNQILPRLQLMTCLFAGTLF